MGFRAIGARAQDLSRGYFDAGDYVKYGQPGAYTVAMLAWSAGEFKSGLLEAGAYEETIEAIRWGADYILKAGGRLHQNCTFAAQVGRGAQDGCTSDDCVRAHPRAPLSIAVLHPLAPLPSIPTPISTPSRSLICITTPLLIPTDRNSITGSGGALSAILTNTHMLASGART